MVLERKGQEVATCLERLGAGDQSAADRLLPIIYDELRAMARGLMQHERVGHTLQPTALVAEAYMRLVNADDSTWTNRAQFLGIASRVIRQVLIDHARRRSSQKRGGGWKRLTITAQPHADDGQRIDLLALDEALDKLRRQSERQARVVELRFFGGMSDEEAAAVLGVSPRTVRGDWTVARAWLWRELGGSE